MAENAEASTSPMMKIRISVQNRLAYGKTRVKGATPRMDAQITRLRPIRSPTGPPTMVPAATANRNRKRCSWADCTLSWNLLIR